MKIDFVKSLIAIAVSALVTYGLYNIGGEGDKLILVCGSSLFLALTLTGSIGINFKFPRTTTNIRIVSSIFFIIAFSSNLVFSFITFSIPSYVITNGILSLLFILISYSIFKAKQ